MTPDEKRIAAKVEERRRWAELQRTYERCIVIADDVWGERLDAAQLAQEGISQLNRDRTAFEQTVAREIYVPLFTPRDREEFIAREVAKLMISAERRGLTVTPELKDAATKSPEGEAPAIEAASGADETAVVEGDGAPVEAAT